MADAPLPPPNDNEQTPPVVGNSKKPGKADCVDSLIRQLTHGDCPKQAMGCPVSRGLSTAIITFAYVLLVAFIKDFRTDIETLGQGLYAIEIGIALLIGTTSLVAASFLMAPDCYGRRWFVAVPYLLFAALFAMCMSRCMAVEHLMNWHVDIVKQCWFNFWAFGVLPIAAVIFWARRGATVYPVQMGLLQALGTGALGWIGQRLTCPVDDPQHIYIVQWLPVIVVGVLLGLLARRLYKW